MIHAKMHQHQNDHIHQHHHHHHHPHHHQHYHLQERCGGFSGVWKNQRQFSQRLSHILQLIKRWAACKRWSRSKMLLMIAKCKEKDHYDQVSMMTMSKMSTTVTKPAWLWGSQNRKGLRAACSTDFFRIEKLTSEFEIILSSLCIYHTGWFF